MEKFKDLFAESRARTLIVIGVLVVALAVPITVRLVGQQQDLRQLAAGPTCGEGEEAINHNKSCSSNSECVTSDNGNWCYKGQCWECSSNYAGSQPGNPEKKDNGEKCNSNSECKSSLCGVKYQFGQAVNVCVATAPQGNNSCGSVGKACCSGNKCNSGLRCDGGKCVASWYCNGDSDCDSNEICENNRCIEEEEDDSPSEGGIRYEDCGEWTCYNNSTCAARGQGGIRRYCQHAIDSGGFDYGAGYDYGGCTDTCGGGSQDDPDNDDPKSGDDDDDESSPIGGGVTRPGSGDSSGDDNNQSSGPLACNASCSNVNACAGASKGCTVCDGVKLPSGSVLFGKCKPPKSPKPTPTATKAVSPFPSTTVTVSPTKSISPSPTPTPTTPAGACGTRCTSDSQCGGAGDGCGTCAFVGQTKRMTCQRDGITPTPSVGPNDVSLTLNLRMPGIGQNTGDNQNPNNTNRTTQVLIYNSNNEEVGNTSGTSQYDGTGTYTATLSSSQVSDGIYYLKARFDNTLMTRIAGVIQLTQGETTNTPVTTLIPGDLNSDNILDIRDFNKFIACYGTLQCNEKSLADLNDDGQVGAVDYNILLRSFAIREGD